MRKLQNDQSWAEVVKSDNVACAMLCAQADQWHNTSDEPIVRLEITFYVNSDFFFKWKLIQVKDKFMLAHNGLQYVWKSQWYSETSIGEEILNLISKAAFRYFGNSFYERHTVELMFV